MLGIMNHVIRTATGTKTSEFNAFERELQIREAHRIERQKAREELRRWLYRKISM